MAEAERVERRRRVTQDCARLGSVAVQRVGTVLQEVWEDGPAFRELTERLRQIATTREGARAGPGALFLSRGCSPYNPIRCAPRPLAPSWIKLDSSARLNEADPSLLPPKQPSRRSARRSSAASHRRRRSPRRRRSGSSRLPLRST